ncbi:MAG: CDP-diacylglycerol O-phosphatidyltransferase [Candidatus Wallbacteria bacterium]|nr:CDP-diacylglycerol O-phosphatidyltransferase [Candidatus Wallbacteria bacterium]
MSDRARIVLSWCVHLYTGLGLLTGFMALEAGVAGDARRAFLWLFAALFIDSTDGTMARAVDVKRWAPTFDGRKLDDITDYLNYVFIPLFLAWRFGLIGAGWFPALLLALLASGYGFCNEAAKTTDNFFTGFPSYWNIAVLYAYVLKLPLWVNGASFVALALLVFAPIKCLYPSKTAQHKALNIVLTCVWFAMIFAILLDVDRPPAGLAAASLAYPVYYFGMSLWLQFGKRPAGEEVLA